MRCQGNSLIPILELRCIFSFNKLRNCFCSAGGSGARLGDDAGQTLAASRGAPASSELWALLAEEPTDLFENAKSRVGEKAIRVVREMIPKLQADAALQLPKKRKSEPSLPGAPPPEQPSLESPEGERLSKKAKSCAEPAAIGAASSSGSQELVQTASAPGPLLKLNFNENSKKSQHLEVVCNITDRNVLRCGHLLFDEVRTHMADWCDEVGEHRALWKIERPCPPWGVDQHAYNKATPPFNR